MGQGWIWGEEQEMGEIQMVQVEVLELVAETIVGRVQEIAVRAGTLGLEVLLNRVPPIKIGIRVLVRGILRVESPRFGIKTARIIPVTRAISGSRNSISSVVSIRASPPGYS